MSAGATPARENRFGEFFDRHGKRPWTPMFNAHLLAIINDPGAPDSERVLAYAIVRSWGRHADCAVDDNGRPLIQSDFSRRLEIARQRVSEAVTSLGTRNLLRMQGGFLYPVDDPSQLAPPPEDEKLSGLPGQTGTKGEQYQRFEVEVWLSQYSDLEREDAEICARRKQIKAQKLAAFKQWKAAQVLSKVDQNLSGLPGQVVRDSPPPVSATPRTIAAPILIYEKEEIEEEGLTPPTPSLEVLSAALNPEVLPPEEPLPPKWSRFEFAAITMCKMQMTSAQRPMAIALFDKLADAEREAAIVGIDERLDSGQYVPGSDYVPYALTYLKQKKWEERVRVDAKKAQKETLDQFLTENFECA
jgi:hypothetical protein